MAFEQSMRNRSRRGTRPGLTLLELIVVLTILVALAGILVPLLPNLFVQADNATEATQFGELAKAIQTYQATTMGYPNNFDLLTDGSKFPAYLPPTGGAAFAGWVEAKTLTAAELSALTAAGIQYVQPLATDTTPQGFDCTLNPYPNTTLTANQVDLTTSAASSEVFAVIDPTTNVNVINNTMTFLQTLIAADPTARYVVFGVGARCSLVGQSIQEAPVAVPHTRTFTPATNYSRFGVIFKVSGTEIARLGQARYVTACSLEDDGLETTPGDIAQYWQIAQPMKGQ